MAEISALGDYGELKIPNMLDVMSKQAQTDTYNLNVAKQARDFNALKMYGQGAAEGDPEAQANLLARSPDQGKTVFDAIQTGVQTKQAKENLVKGAAARVAQTASQFDDPAQQTQVFHNGIDLLLSQKAISQAEADNYKHMASVDPQGMIRGIIHGNLSAAQTPVVAGQTATAQLPSAAAQIGIRESYQPPLPLPKYNPNTPGNYDYPLYPRGTIPGAGTAPGMQYGPNQFNPTIVPSGPPSSGGLPGVTRTPIAARPASSSGPSSPSEPETGPAAEVIRRETAKYPNLDPELTMTTAEIESNFGKTPDRPGSQYRGMFQLGENERNMMGGSGISHGVGFMSQRKNQLASLLGREPANWETYLAHQQGAAGAAALINNPTAPAGEVISRVGGAPRNIAGNGGDPNAPSSAFTERWKQDYERRAARYRGGGGAAPTAPGSTAPSTTAPAAPAPAPAPAATGVGSRIVVPAASPGPSTGMEPAPEPPPIVRPGARPVAAPAGPAPSAAEPASAAPGSGKRGFGMYVGDSITAQQIRHGGDGTEDMPNKGQPIQPGSTAGIGDGPRRVVERIDTLDKVPETVFLSSGATNRPGEVDATGEAVDKLRAKGAQYVVVPGVGPGVPNADKVNQQLRETVEAHGGIFFEPQVKWVTNKNESGIHPAEVDKVNEQALQALQRAKASATIPKEERSSLGSDGTSGSGAQPGGADLAAGGGGPDTVEYPNRSGQPIQLAAGGPDVLLPREGPTATPIPGVTEPPTAATTAQAMPPGYSALPPGVIPAPNPIEQGMLKDAHDYNLKEFRERVGKDAIGAATGLGAIKKLEAILDAGYVSGTGGEQVKAINTAISTFANMIGKSSSITDKQAAAADMFQSIGKQLGFDMVTALGSREAQQIVAQVMDIKPSILHSVAGNRAIMASLRQVFEMQVDKKNFYEKWLSNPKNYGKFGVEDAFFKEHPIEIYSSKAMPLALPITGKGDNRKLDTDGMTPGAYYNISDMEGHKEGDRGLWTGKALKPAGRVPWMVGEEKK